MALTESLLAMLIPSDSAITYPERLTYVENDTNYTPPQSFTPPAGTISYDTVTEKYGNTNIVYGFCIKDRGLSTEDVTYIIFPDASTIQLVGF